MHKAVNEDEKTNPEDIRTVADTIETVKWQIRKACTGNQKAIQDKTSQTGVKDKIAQYWIAHLLAKSKKLKEERIQLAGVQGADRKKEIERAIEQELWEWVLQQPKPLDDSDPLRNELRAGDHFNILLEMPGLNVHKDTAVEILHTYLLGNDKYAWYETWSNWLAKENEEIFANRLQSASLDGLSIMVPRAQYLIRYKNNLIGKHFRVLQQLAIFQTHDLVSPKILALWRATGELGALLWYPEIADMEEYLNDLQILIDNLLDAWGQYDPQRIITKIKLRLLPYLVQDIRRFGPAILYATEIFESHNHVFRLCSVYSNHHAPSLDIANTLAGAERFKHMISGGWWKATDGNWIQAGPGIRNLFREGEETRRRLGWNMNPDPKCGDVSPPSIRKSASRTRSGEEICEAETGLAHSEHSYAIKDADWLLCLTTISQSKDVCREGSWVFFRLLDGTESIGKIVHILQQVSAPATSWIILKVYDVDSNRDPHFNMPILTPSGVGCVLAKPTDILFLFNAQHDCRTAKCTLSSDTGEFFMQEKIDTDDSKTVVVHSLTDRYIINMHALHNAHLLRRALPRSLTQPVPFHEKPEEVRTQLAASLRVTGQAKRAAAKAKASQNRELRKGLEAAQMQDGGR